MASLVEVAPEVSSALNRNQPVVALESSVIAQGLPAKVNLKTALEMEEAVREAGATPATIGMIAGKVRVGLTRDQIERLAAGGAEKIGIRDLPYAAVKGLEGGTTVSATIRIAAASGIMVVVTGGIGGVHRGFAEANDVSADLWELARTPAVVVCSGVKAVLDIRATLEWLETHCVPVYGYQTQELPAFYSCSSGLSVPCVGDVKELGEVLRISRVECGFQSAAVVAVPIPKSDEIDVSNEMEQAEQEARDQGIRGKELTPFLLNRVAELSGSKSVAANAALLKNNCKVGGEIAAALARQTQRRMGFLS